MDGSVLSTGALNSGPPAIAIIPAMTVIPNMCFFGLLPGESGNRIPAFAGTTTIRKKREGATQVGHGHVTVMELRHPNAYNSPRNRDKTGGRFTPPDNGKNKGEAMETIGFIGLGNMGGGMAGNIQAAGYPMVVYDLREEATKPFLEAGARLGDSPADVASRSDITLTSLPGPKEVEQVSTGLGGVLEGMKPDGIYIDLSTSRPTLIREIEPKFREKGCHVLDAPVSGGKSGAASRNLAVMVGGEEEIYQRVRPLLDAFGDKVFYAGSIGAGSVCKLVHNMIGHGVRQAIAEGLTLGVKAGVDAESLWECVRRGSLGRMNLLHEGVAPYPLQGRVRPAQLRAVPGEKRRGACHRPGTRVRRADAGGQSGGADCHPGDEPGLGRPGRQRNLPAARGGSRRRGQGPSG